MYKLTRIVDGATETLKDSNNNLIKTFKDFVAAELHAKRLNLNLILFDNDYWKVETI
ncbi:hypothetical protein [Shouchella patagoniensis]|uniref:hypothetical protein n=1 Tax=Shouchella patagoniensis TaxID=228576 RepID=UPI00147654DB|nr:hypothetical protein [Shouchella patagoniensis]